MAIETHVPDLDDPAQLARHEAVLRTVLTIRATEERLLSLFSEGRLFGTVHTCIGQEFTGPAVARALREDDTVFSNHRCHGHFIACCDEVEGLVAEIMGKSTGVCGGIGGSQHLHHRRFYSNGVQGGIVPVAAGLALAHRRDGRGAISVVFVGDGTLGEGTLYETLNLAARWELPLLVVLENNLYSQSTPQAQTLAGGIAERFAAFGIETAHGSTWDWPALLDGMADSVARVRESGRPRFHQVDTYRLMAHSKGDDDRAGAEIESYRRRDPLALLLERHAGHPWLVRTRAEIGERVERAVAAAEAAPWGALEPPPPAPAKRAWTPAAFRRERVVHAVRGALAGALERDPKVIVFGEDVESPYGGAFKCTAGLSDAHPGRVRNTPLSEAAIVGLGNGAALAGHRPVVEIMFGDFLTLATDQWVNHAAKFAGMYHGRVRVPLVVRTPMGGHRGYGPTHSQSLERLFTGHPGTRVLALHHRAHPGDLYARLFEAGDLPTLVVENKLLYGADADPQAPPGYRLLVSDDRFPVTRLAPEGRADVTLVALGGISLDAERALQVLFEQHEIAAELFLPSQLYPLDAGFLEDSLLATRRLVVAEEGQGFAAVGGEILAQVAERPALAGCRCARVFAAPHPIPSSRPLEAQCLPGADQIVAKALEVCHG
jgi:2-oxoisovalerate dehydrogenase E1 component